MKGRDFWYAASGALAFTLVWLLLSFFFSPDPDYVIAVAGGAAWFVGSLVLRAQDRTPKTE